MFSARGCVPVSSLGSVRGNTVPRDSIDPYTPWEQGWDWILWSLLIISFNIIPVASGYEEIHLYSGMNIDNVKINTSLIMMKEWVIHQLRADFQAKAMSNSFFNNTCILNNALWDGGASAAPDKWLWTYLSFWPVWGHYWAIWVPSWIFWGSYWILWGPNWTIPGPFGTTR